MGLAALLALPFLRFKGELWTLETEPLSQHVLSCDFVRRSYLLPRQPGKVTSVITNHLAT